MLQKGGVFIEGDTSCFGVWREDGVAFGEFAAIEGGATDDLAGLFVGPDLFFRVRPIPKALTNQPLTNLVSSSTPRPFP